MSNVQQPEMRRSGHDPLVADSAKERAAAAGGPGAPRKSGPGKDTRPAAQRSPYGPEGGTTVESAKNTAYLHGGPLDGQRRTAPTDADGEPKKLAEFDHEARGSGWYVEYRRTHRGDGDGWHYEYTGNKQKPDEEG